MANRSLINKVLAKAPLLEIIVRHIFWKNIKFFTSNLIQKKRDNQSKIVKVSFDLILTQWSKWGVKNGDTILLTSSYNNLQALQLEPEEIINKIIDFLGDEGTLIMPAFPYYKNSPKKIEYLSKNLSNETFIYNSAKNLITTGILPSILSKYPNAQRSKFPINTLVAYGKYSTEIFANEWQANIPLPCGINSGWAFAASKNAKIISLGTDLTHSLTIIHNAEDCEPEKWPIKNWYRQKKFLLKENGIEKVVILNERDPKWGTLYYAERKLCYDLTKSNILKSCLINNIETEMLESNLLLNFLAKKNKNGYPYLFIPKKFKKNFHISI
jgi:aminoglycoside 3-N-acetyltransferase